MTDLINHPPHQPLPSPINTNQSFLQDIIKLQLKKPKRWNWELTTSQSLPHIAMPVIQLFDAKGKILVNTADVNNNTSNTNSVDMQMKRRSWHSNAQQDRDMLGKDVGSVGKTSYGIKGETQHQHGLEKSQSQVAVLNRCHTSAAGASVNNDRIREKGEDGSGGGRNGIEKSASDVTLGRLKKRTSPHHHHHHRRHTNTANDDSEEEEDGDDHRHQTSEARRQRKQYRLVKSRSDVLANMINRDSDSRDRNESRKSGSRRGDKKREISSSLRLGKDDKWNLDEMTEEENNVTNLVDKSQIQYKRSCSDDLFSRLSKEPENEIVTTKPNTAAAKTNSGGKLRKTLPIMQAVEYCQSPQKQYLDVETFHHQRYKTRTSSAGTLIIKVDSFSAKNNRRRRRKTDLGAETSDENGLSQENNKSWLIPAKNYQKSCLKSKSQDFSKQSSCPVNKNCQVSQGESLWLFPSSSVNLNNDRQLQVNKSGSIRQSRSEVFPRESFLRSKASDMDVIGFDGFMPTSESEKLEGRRRAGGGRKARTRRRKTAEETNLENDKARIVKEHRAPNTTNPTTTTTTTQLKHPSFNDRHHSAGDANHHPHQASVDLVHQLVHRLTAGDHVSMGSNVSRQSSRGLSGRRTQSSGSICRGRHNSSNRSGRSGVGRSGVPAPPGDEDDLTDDGDSSDKVCGSLPSYLDERYAGNNNHLVDDLVSVLGDDGAECKKQQQLDDVVDRIPPLGDTVGAPLHWKFSDGTQPVAAAAETATATTTTGGTVLLCDQGYGSERSPEEEYPPPLPDHDNLCHHHLELHTCYPFITPESTFSVSLAKGSRGLGLSVTGGIDSGGSWPGLIRVKRLFPHQPAASCAVLNVGDLILEANGIPLTGLTNYEALEVLRTAPNQVELRICRPPPDVLNCVSPISEVPPPPPRREPPATLNLSAGISSDEDYHGEFEITMRKIQGSLGFTLRKEDDSALGHYIRALVREPALKDGRIRAGDKIIAVNDNEISEMSHEEAVQFLRQCGDLVKLRLYRDAAQTPIATLSPTETTPRTSFCKKAQLRQEAVDMLNDIAVRKLIPADIQNQHHHHNHHPPLAPTSSTTSSHRSSSPNNTTSSPNRRLRRNITNDLPTITTTSSNNNTAPPISATNSLKFHSSHHHQQLLNEEQFHEALLADGVYHSGHIPLDEDAFNSLFLDDDGEGDDDDPDRPSRPSSLDLYNPNQTPVAARKPKFNFSLAHNAYELNNLDAEILDAPNLTYNMNEDVNSAEVESTDGGYPQEPASMPHIPSTSSEHPMAFSYKNPAYQSAHPQCSTTIENGVSGSQAPQQQQAAPKTPARSGSSKSSNNSGTGNSQQQSGNSQQQQQQQQQQDDSNMKKWKGVSMGADEMASEEDRGTIRRRRKPILKESKPLVEEEPKILAIELNRGWNSRLGFSLQGAAGVTYVSAVHADSVAARDGRIKPGDRVLKVNDENVEHLTTNEIIDLLRIVRGPVCIVVSRGKTSQNSLKSNAVN